MGRYKWGYKYEIIDITHIRGLATPLIATVDKAHIASAAMQSFVKQQIVPWRGISHTLFDPKPQTLALTLQVATYRGY